MQIRKAKIEDIEKVAQLMERNGYDREGAVRRASSIGRPDRCLFILDNAAEVMGYAGIKKQSEQFPIDFDTSTSQFAQILWVGVHYDFRHKGFGSKLVRACDDVALKFERQNIVLVCREEVISFYQGIEYREIGSYIDERLRLRFVMVKDISKARHSSYRTH